MDEVTRGFLEQTIDEWIKEDEFTSEINWIQQEIPLSSFREVALGFTVGSLVGVSEAFCALKKPKQTKKENEKDSKEILGIIKRRLPEIIEKIDKELGR